MREFERMADNFEGMLCGMLADVNQMIRLAEYIGIGLVVLVGMLIFMTLVFACFMRGAFAKLLSFCVATTVVLLHLEPTGLDTLYQLAKSGHNLIRVFESTSEKVNGFYLNQAMIDSFLPYLIGFTLIFFISFAASEILHYLKSKKDTSESYYSREDNYEDNYEDFCEESYRVLGVDIGAGKEEVKRAYRRLVKKYHPDLGGDAEKFKRVQKAYQKIQEEGIFA